MTHYSIAPQARDDLQAIWDYIAIENGKPSTANSFLARLCRKFALLATQPLMGQARDDLRPGLRVFTAGSYVIFYYPQPDGVEVAGVVHGAQDVEAMFRAGQR